MRPTSVPEIASQQPYPFPPGLDALVALEPAAHAEGELSASAVIPEELLAADGTVHAGLQAAIAERTAELATALAIGDGHRVRVLTSQASYLEPLAGTAVSVRAVRRHHGRTTWVWDVTVGADVGGTCTMTRTTVGVSDSARELRSPATPG